MIGYFVKVMNNILVSKLYDRLLLFIVDFSKLDLRIEGRYGLKLMVINL